MVDEGIEALLLHFAAEVAQPMPIWPRGMLYAMYKRCSLGQLDYVKTLVGTLGSMCILVGT